MSDNWGSEGLMDKSPRQRGLYPSQHGPYVAQGGDTDPFRENRNFASAAALNENGSPTKNKNKENLHRVAGLCVGLASVVSEHVLSHPCIVLRRQCQVHNESSWYHLTPFSLFQTIFNIHRHQSATTLWKGIGSTLIVKGIGIATETAITEVTPFPKEVTRHTPIKKLAQHILLKGITFVIITPFYAASLVETVQSEIASERPGVLDCLREGAYRLISLSSPQTTRLLPVWKLFFPVVAYGVAHYVIAALSQYTVMASARAEILNKKRREEKTTENSLYETYYPELISTFTGNLLADTLLYPFETLLHRLCLQGTRTIIDNTDSGMDVIPIITRYEGFIDCLQSVLREEGLGGLYKGFGALVLQYGIHMAILRLTKLLFRLTEEEEFLTPDASPAKRMIIPTEVEDIRQRQARYAGQDSLPR